MLPLLLAIILAEIAEGSLDAKAVALLGILAAGAAALRVPSPGIDGFEPIWFLIILAARVYGRGFGFVLGALALFTSALITGGVGPWLPFEMFGAAWMGLGAACLPPAAGRRELALLAAYAAVACLVYGMLLNLWFWPFVGPTTVFGFVPGAGIAHQPAPLRLLRPGHLARLRHPPGDHQRRADPRARSPGAGGAATRGAAGRLRRPGHLRRRPGRPARGGAGRAVGGAQRARRGSQRAISRALRWSTVARRPPGAGPMAAFCAASALSSPGSPSAASPTHPAMATGAPA